MTLSVRAFARIALPIVLGASAALSADLSANAPATRWTVVASRSDSVPALGSDGTIYLGTFGQKLYAISTNGGIRWTFNTDSEIKSSPALGRDGTIYFGCRDRKFYAVGEGGEKKWEFRTGAWVDSSPAIGTDGTIYFGSWDKKFYALNPDGTVRWKFETGAEIDSSPAIGSDGTVYFGSHDKKFYALAPDGGKRWEFVTRGQIVSSPALTHDGVIYITSTDGFLYALDEGGALRWRLHTGGIGASSPVLAPDGTIYVGVNKTLQAVAPDGQKKLAWAAGNLLEISPTIAENDVVYVSFRFGVLTAFKAGGDALWYYRLHPFGDSMPAIGPDGTIYIAGSDSLHALETTNRLASSSWPKFRGNSRNTGNLSDSHP